MAKVNYNSVEQDVLGAILADPECVDKVLAVIQADDFQNVKHRTIFQTMFDLHQRARPIDLATIQDELFRREKLDSVGGRNYLINLIESVPGALSVVYHAKRVKDNAIAEKARQKAINFIANIGNGGEVNNLLSEHIFELSQLQARTTGIDLLSMEEIAAATIHELDQMKNGKIAGINTGLPFLDDTIGGFYPGELITIAGLTGVGKTNFALQIADHIAVENNMPVIYIPLEMVPSSLFKRLVLGRSHKITSFALRKGQLSEDQWVELTSLANSLADAKIYMPSKIDIKFSDIPALIQKAKAEFDVRAVFIDYLQLIDTGMRFESGVAEQTYISRSLKMTMRKYEIVGFSVAQFRKLQGAKAMPRLDDLKGSGAIPQDSDFVIFVHREHDDNIFKNEGSIEIAKGRESITDVREIIYKHPRFYEADKIHGYFSPT